MHSELILEIGLGEWKKTSSGGVQQETQLSIKCKLSPDFLKPAGVFPGLKLCPPNDEFEDHNVIWK